MAPESTPFEVMNFLLNEARKSHDPAVVYRAEALQVGLAEFLKDRGPRPASEETSPKLEVAPAKPEVAKTPPAK